MPLFSRPALKHAENSRLQISMTIILTYVLRFAILLSSTIKDVGALKKPVALRLSEKTIKELDTLTKRYKVSQADVVAVLIHCVAQHGEIVEERLEEFFAIVERC